MKTQDTHYIHPEDLNNLNYWSKKWGVTSRQLTDAILNTGSIRTTELKDYLRKNVYYYSPLFGIWKLIKDKFIH
jgi:hypothetical protein